MARTGSLVTIGNLKGGVGKSTLTVNLAAEMTGRGLRVCLVDCDPQLTSANWLVGGGFGVHVIAMPLQQVTHAKIWLTHVKALSASFDLVLIDLPAAVSPALASAILVSHLVLVPLQPSGIDIHATQRMVHYIVAAQREREAAPPEVMMVPMRVQAAKQDSSAIEAKLQRFGQRVAQGLRDHTAFSEAFDAHSWVGANQGIDEGPHSDLRQLADQVQDCLSRAPMPPALAVKVNLLDRIMRRSPPIGDLSSNHRDGLVWWKRLVTSGK